MTSSRAWGALVKTSCRSLLRRARRSRCERSPEDRRVFRPYGHDPKHPATQDHERIMRAQRLASPVVVYIEAFSAHPMELDAADNYAPVDGYLDESGEFIEAVEGKIPDGTTAVYRVELRPSDGPFYLPYVARMADGGAWNFTGTSAFAGRGQSRQTFYPDASRLYEEIDNFGLDGGGRGRLLSRQAEFTFVRALPSSGYLTERAASAAGLSPE